MISSTSNKLSNPFRTLEPKKNHLAFTGEIALGSNKLAKDYPNFQTENKSPQIIEGSKLKLNLDIFNTINPPKANNEKNFLEKKNNEQAQTQPVFQNKLSNDLNNKAGNITRSNANQTPLEKPSKFFDDKGTNNLDIKTKNLATEINALDKILLSKDKSNAASNNEGYLSSKLKDKNEANAGTIPVLSSATKPKNKLQEIKTDDTVDAYLQLKMNTASTAKARKILPSREKNKANEEKNKPNQEKNIANEEKNKTNEEKKKTNELKQKESEKMKTIEQKEIKKEPLKIEKKIHSKQPANININKNNNNNQKTEEKPFEGEEKLYECTEGCGRKFNAKALEIHVKVCKKVFQSKPKEENKKEEKKQNEKKDNGQKKGKWQKQSEAFRAVVKAAKNQFAEGEEKENNTKKEKEKKDMKKKINK